MSNIAVPFYRHALHDDDIDAVTQVLRSLELTAGAVTRDAEAKLADYTGMAHAVGVSNGTSALFLALKALDVGPGDEVITTPMTFVSTSNAILHTGATPVFVDVEADTGLIDVALLEQAITPRTKAVIPVHLYGQMTDMKAIASVCDQHRLAIIEDAAHALEAERDGLRPGATSKMVCYSFYATKNLTSGEGGAVCTNDPELADRVRQLRLHGIRRPQRKPGRYGHWEMESLGYKSLLPNILAALLIHQMDRLDDLWTQRQSIAKRYIEAFSTLKQVRMPSLVPTSRSAYHLFPLWVPASRRDSTLVDLQSHNIGASVHYRAVHLNAYYREQLGFQPGSFPVAESIGAQTLSLPFYPGLQEKEVEAVIQAVQQVVGTWEE